MLRIGPMRGARRRRALRYAPALLVILTGVLLLPNATAASKVERADLVVTQVIVRELPAARPPHFYAAVDSNGNAPTFTIKVTVKNIGNARARRTWTYLKVENNLEGAIYHKIETTGPLTPGMYRRVSFEIRGLKPQLGILIPIARADEVQQVKESREKNNSKVGRSIMVVAQRWKVLQFQTVINNTAIGSSTYTAAGSTDSPFYFRLTRFDETKELFEYVPTGLLRAGYDETGVCTSHGKDQKTMDPWPGELWLNDQLVGYTALIDTYQQPVETTPYYCGGKLIGNVGWDWSNPKTIVDAAGDDYPRMSPDDTQLTGSFKKDVTGGNQTWSWTFQADVTY